ncbi:hypothetical protein [Cedecea sp. NFIX57]|uniref:hypothetical protein n=1 Tax=Cedecea sp. NFIX57 TaxID=1566286 RepID=UPI000A0A4B74|nr:hypothetical protein [Cedecea sp. NFIX57]SMG61754.1 hypothetical protein SAMN03159353_105720 [Cedecea sp. NFIX57]
MSNVKNIQNLMIGVDGRSLETLSHELVAMKITIGLLFQKLPAHEKDNLIKSLKAHDNEYLGEMAGALEQFKI